MLTFAGGSSPALLVTESHTAATGSKDGLCKVLAYPSQIIYVYKCIYIYIYTYMYIYTYIHMYMSTYVICKVHNTGVRVFRGYI